jgi:hypothetical protein
LVILITAGCASKPKMESITEVEGSVEGAMLSPVTTSQQKE